MISNPMKYLTIMSGPFDPAPMKLFIRGKNPDMAMATAADLTDTLNEYGVPRPSGASFRQWIAAIRMARNGHGAPALSSLGGTSGRSLLWVADQTLNTNGDFAAPPGAEIRGQIEQQCELTSTSLVDGYVYDSSTGSGYLCVTVFTTTTQGGSNTRITQAERFLVQVEAGGFEVRVRCNLADPNCDRNDPFPGTVSFDQETIDRIWDEGFTHKLWAKGISIRVRKVWRNMNYDTNPNNFTPVNLNAKPYRSLKVPNIQSCVDMMFAGVPPSTIAGLQSPPFYCLGRCASPPIINTR
jgi:hypothetical protein